jgi:hypothetical protein
VQFKVYSLIGKLVWTSERFAAGSLQGSRGDHAGEIFWDGQNDVGKDVLSGIYILVMQTGNGTVQKTKIAFVR